MKNLDLIQTLTAALHKNATDTDGENFKLTDALLEGISAMTDSKFAESLMGCGYEPDFGHLVSKFKARCFAKDVAVELVKVFEGNAVTISVCHGMDGSDNNISITYNGSDDSPYFDSGAVLWIYSRPAMCENMRTGDASKRGSKFFKAECELGTDYGPDVLVSFEAATAKEVADKVKATLDADREKYPEDVKA
tara:strand:+ start:255 stop:833 length:579 start_codon:yes stop_codon:yes gene_type:complete